MMRKITAIFLVILCLVSLLAGCEKKPGFEMLNAKNERFLLVKVSNVGESTPEVVIRKMEKDKQTEKYVATQEYIPVNANGDNVFGQTVQENGIYQVEASCEGFKTATYTVYVKENKIYTLGIFMET